MKIEAVKNYLLGFRDAVRLRSREYLARVNHNRYWFNFFFLFLIPALYIPINYFNPIISAYIPYFFTTSTTILSSVLVYNILGNAFMIKSIFQNENNTNSQDHQNALNHSRDTIRGMYITGITFVAILVVLIFFFLFNSVMPSEISTVSLILSYVISPFMVLSVLLAAHLFIHERGKNFSFELARSWLFSINDKMTDLEKINRLTNVIENFNEHITISLRRKINDIDYLYTRLVNDTKNTNQLVETIRQKFRDGNFALMQYFLTVTNDNKIQLIRPRKFVLNNDLVNLVRAISILISIIISISNSEKILDVIGQIWIK